MKKVIAAAAGLMLVGAMVSTATAAVSLSGDARARWYFEQNSDGTAATDQDEKFSSRVRVKFNATAEGGAYAKARIRMADAVWDGTALTRAKGEGSNLYVDYAYIGMPIGPVTVEAGLMPQDLNLFAYWDRREDMFSVKYANDMTTAMFWFQKDAEYTDPATDTIDDEDMNSYWAILTQKFSDAWSMTLVAAYQEDQTDADMSGFFGLISADGNAGGVALTGTFAYQEGDILGTDDDSMGGYLQASMDFGAASLALNTGFTKDGFVADDDFGFIMIGGASAITPAITENVGGLGDTYWVGGIAGFKVSEDLSLKGILAYADIDEVASAFEISGAVKYIVSAGANIEWVVGFVSLDPEVGDLEDPFGTAVTLNVSF